MHSRYRRIANVNPEIINGVVQQCDEVNRPRRYRALCIQGTAFHRIETSSTPFLNTEGRALTCSEVQSIFDGY